MKLDAAYTQIDTPVVFSCCQLDAFGKKKKCCKKYKKKGKFCGSCPNK